MKFLTDIAVKLLYKVLNDLVLYFKKLFERKKEQTERHGENTGNVDDFKNADPQRAKDEFSKLP